MDSHTLMRCNSCGLVHLNEAEVHPEKFLDDVTSGGEGLEYWGYPEYFRKHQLVFDFFFEERLQRLQDAEPVPGLWFDVGSGYGLWQQFLKQKAISCKGIEIEAQAFHYAHKQGLDVEHVSIEKFQADHRFSVITMCDVLEHVAQPLDVLKKCWQLLEPGGLLYLQVPNVIGLKIPYGDSLGLPHHLWQFDPVTLKALVIRAGFKPITTWTGVQGVIKHYEKGGPDLLTRGLWNIARWTKRGNRLQLLVRK